MSESEMLAKLLCHLLWTLVGSSLAYVAALTSCGAPPAGDRPLFGSGVFHPPPKPGSSISQTQMCECQACDPSACCEGPADEAASEACGNSYDFSENASCGGLSVRSCASRCTRQIWRVGSRDDCASKRPPSCCPAG